MGGGVREYRYQILVSGLLGEAGCEAFRGFAIEFCGNVTTVVARLDQSALFGAVHRVQSLGLELVGIKRLPL